MKEITLTQGKVALVDDEDFEWLSQWKWYARKGKLTWYAIRNPNIRMHRELCGLKSYKINPVQVDHKDLNGLNNQKDNLRKVNNQQNQMNTSSKKGTSIYKGVAKEGSSWKACIGYNYQYIRLGTFKDEKEAAIAYDYKARELFGDFANLNFPEINRPATGKWAPKVPYRGVSMVRSEAKTPNRYIASITHGDTTYHLGLFKTPKQAAEAYDKKASKLKGTKAKLNFPKGL